MPRLPESLLENVGILPTSLSSLASMAGSRPYNFLKDYGMIMAALTGTYIHPVRAGNGVLACPVQMPLTPAWVSQLYRVPGWGPVPVGHPSHL
jgi:hypothetical protein